MAWTPTEVPIATWGVENDGDVDGPASSTDNAVVRFNGTSGKILQNSGVIIDDSDAVTGITDLTLTGALATPTSITMAEDGWIGIGAAAERIIFDGTGGAVQISDGSVEINFTFPASIPTITTDASRIDVNTPLRMLTTQTLGFRDGQIYIWSPSDSNMAIVADGSISITSPSAIFSGNLTMPEDGWIGIGAAAERIVFDGTGGDINVQDANFGVRASTPQGVIEGRTDQNAATRVIVNNDTVGASASARFSMYDGTTERAYLQYANDGTGQMTMHNSGGKIVLSPTNSVIIEGTDRLEFRDSTTYIYSAGAGYLDLEAATGVRLNTQVTITDDDGLLITGDYAKLYFVDTGAGENEDAYIVNNASLLAMGVSNTPSSGNDYLVLDFGEANAYFTNCDVGIGTTTVPHGGVGGAKLAIDGTASSSAAGPNMQFTVSTDDYPVIQILPFLHDNASILFDAYLNNAGSAWESSDVGSNFRMAKGGLFADTLGFAASSGNAQGASVSWTTAFQIESDAEVLFSPSAARKLYFRDSALYISSKADGYLDFDADTGFRFNTSGVAIGASAVVPKSGFDATGWITLSGSSTGMTFIDEGAANASRYIACNAGYMDFGKMDDDGTNGVTQFYLHQDGLGVGIGTGTVPHGGIGAAKLAIDGTDSSTAGPHVQFTTASDDYPLLQILAYAHDDVNQSFDSYFDGTNWRVGDTGTGTAFAIAKRTNALRFRYASGVAQGGIISWAESFSIESDGEVLFSPAAARRLYFRDSDASVWSNSAGYLDTYAATQIRLGANTALNADNRKLIFGAGSDAEMYYDGTDLIIDPDAVGSGVLRVGSSAYILGSDIRVGAEGTTRGIARLFGPGAGVNEGGTILLYTAADYDTSIDYFQVRTNQDDLEFLSFGTVKLAYSGGDDDWQDAAGLLFTDTAGAGLPYANMYVKNNAAATTIGVAGTYVQFLGFGVDGESYNATPDHTNDHITIDKAGRYHVSVSVHCESSAGGAQSFAFEVRKNNGATVFNNLHAHRDMAGGGGDVGSVNMVGIIDLDATDTLEIWTTNETSANDVLIEDCSFNVVQVGGS